MIYSSLHKSLQSTNNSREREKKRTNIGRTRLHIPSLLSKTKALVIETLTKVIRSLTHSSLRRERRSAYKTDRKTDRQTDRQTTDQKKKRRVKKNICKLGKKIMKKEKKNFGGSKRKHSLTLPLWKLLRSSTGSRAAARTLNRTPMRAARTTRSCMLTLRRRGAH